MRTRAPNTNPAAPLTTATQLQVRVGKRECPSPHGWRNKIGRVAWGFIYATLFRPSPRLCFGWRRMLLKCFGATIGSNARIHPTVRIWAPWNLTVGNEASVAHEVDCYCVGKLEIGDHATVSQYAMLCTASHDVSDPHMRLITAPIVISPQAWVCAQAFISLGVTVGTGAVVGAQSVVTRSVADWTIVAGNPARVLKTRVLVSKPTE